MREILNQFIENLQGQFVEVSSKEALYQCMDLVYVWIFCLGVPKATIQNQYAFEVFTKPKSITLEYFDLIPNSPTAIPQDGDIVVSKGGEAGHIRIALGGGNTSKFMCFEQNKPLGTHAHVQEATYTNVIGWLRLKKLPSTEPDLSWLRQMYQARGIDLTQPEGTVRNRIQEIFDGSDKYREAVKLKDKALADLGEARGDVAKWEENYNTASKQISELKSEIVDLNIKVTSRDTEIGTLKSRVTALEGQLNPDKVIVVTREEYARLTASKQIDRFTTGELLKAVFSRWFIKKEVI